MRNRKTLLIVMGLLLALLVLPMIAAAQTDEPRPISYGETVTGEITNDMPEVRFTFEGSAGDTITIAMNATNVTDGQPSLDSYAQLFGPNGDLLDFNDDSGGTLNALVGPTRLPETGSYVIVATRCCPGGFSGSTGPFELTVRQVEVPTIAQGEPITFDLTPEDPNGFVFFNSDNATAPFVRATARVTTGEGSIDLRARGPIGREYYSRQVSMEPSIYVLEPVPMDIANGAYLFSVGVTPFYSPDAMESTQGEILPATVELVIDPINAEPLSAGTTVSATLNDETPTATYSFDAQEGDLFSLQAGQSDGTPIELTVYSPEGYSINGGSTGNFGMTEEILNSFSIDPLQIDMAGTYTIVVRRIGEMGFPPAGSTASFELTLSASEIATLEPGVTVTGEFGAQDEQMRIYRYQGTAGQTVLITLSTNGGEYAPSLDVQGPMMETDDMTRNLVNASSSQPGTLTYTAVLPIDGVYLFRIFNGIFGQNGPPAGSFNLRIDIQ
ncbi:MAG: hypothetical protein ACOCXZ_01765 [Chloroflexota bacterium]